MARRETAARRYAEAAFQIGRADGTLDDWERDFATISELLANDEVRRILQHPVIPYAAKERVLQRAATGIRPDVLNLVLLMKERLKAVRGRLAILSQPQNGTTVHACVPVIHDEPEPQDFIVRSSSAS